jgi:hypothetical protein
LVALHFVENEHNRPEVNHIDMNRRNNCAENLEWVTASENKQKAVDLGSCIAANNPRMCRKLTPEDVAEIRKIGLTGIAQRIIAERFGVARVTVSMIMRGVARVAG